MADVAPLVRSSHERRDATGYPDRLCAEQIPRAELVAGAGTRFDPEVVDASCAAISPHRKSQRGRWTAYPLWNE